MSPENGSSRRERIVPVARRLFTSRGYDGTKIGDIADALNVSKAAVSYYFPTKDTFVDELVEPFVQALETAVAAKPDRPSVVDRRTIVGRYLDVLLDHVDIARWVDSDVAIQKAHDVGRRIDQASQRLVATITGDNLSTSAKIAGFAVLGGLWRPVLTLHVDELREHREQVLDAAIASYPRLDRN